MKIRKKAPEAAEPLDSVVDTLIDQKAAVSDVPKEIPKPKETWKQRRKRKKSLRQLQKKSRKLMIPKTVQQTIPYRRVYPDSGIIETRDGVFVRCYLLGDVNYAISRDDDQLDMITKYGELLNSFDCSGRFQILAYQQMRNKADFEAMAMLPLGNDILTSRRKERNNIIHQKIQEGRNELSKAKFLAVQISAPDYNTAHNAFTRMDAEVISNVKAIGGAKASPLSSARYLELIHDLYNPGQVGMFGNLMEQDEEGRMVFSKEKFSFEVMGQMGLSTKDVVGPESFKFQSDWGKVGTMYFRSLFLKSIPSIVKDCYLEKLTEVNCKMALSIHYQPIDTAVALKMVKNDSRSIQANIIDRQKAATQAGYSPDIIPPEMKDNSAECEMIREALTSKNQKLFYQVLVITHFAETKEQLDLDTKAIQAIGQKELLNIRPLAYQQSLGLDATLPLCCNNLEIKRTLLTKGASMFMPFNNLELMDPKDGIYYGINAVSHNLILFNRRNSKNGNGMILGSPGSGKSMIAKQEIEAVLIGSDDCVNVIDPDGEYIRMVQRLGGEIIRIGPGSQMHLNPLDIDMMDPDSNPLMEKCAFICSIFEAISSNEAVLTASQRSLIDRCIKNIYVPYLESRNPSTGQYDSRKLPTLKDLYYELRSQDGYDALLLADSLEMYAVGSQDLFAYQTNVEYHNRFVVYDIKDIGSAMKVVGELVVLSTIWNQITMGRRKGKNTWFYVDEIYLLFQNPMSTEFLKNLYKRARKYGALPTGITQNISDILENPVARSMIANCEFVVMMGHSPSELESLLEVFPNMSTAQMDSIRNAPPGHGLIYDGQNLIPFINELPKDSLQYKAMTTKLSEVIDIDHRQTDTDRSVTG